MMKHGKTPIKKFLFLATASLFVLFGGMFSHRVLASGENSDNTGNTAETLGDDQLLNEIKERGTLRMGTATSYAPFEFIINKNGKNEIVGSDIKLGEQIAADLGVELEIVDMEFGNLITSMEGGHIDIIIAGMSYTEERDKSIDFSAVYQNDDQSFVIRTEDAGKIVNYQSFIEHDLIIGVSDSTLQETIANEIFADYIEVVAMRKTADVISAIQSGQIDGALMDDSVAGAYVAQNEDLINIEAGIEIQQDGKSVGVPENQPSFLAAIDRTIEDVHENDLYNQWIEESYELLRSNQEDSWFAYWPYFWEGIKTTLLISSVSIIAGSILGAGLAFMRISQKRILDLLAQVYIEVIRGTPLMIQVLFIYIGPGAVFGWGTLTSGLVAVSFNSAAYIAEIFRGGITAVDKGQSEAARALGLDYWTTMKDVIVPQSLRSIWPSLGNEFITLIKESAIVSTIGVAELTFQTRAVTALTYQGVQPLLISMSLYLMLTFTLSKLLNRYEKQMNKKYV